MNVHHSSPKESYKSIEFLFGYRANTDFSTLNLEKSRNNKKSQRKEMHQVENMNQRAVSYQREGWG